MANLPDLPDEILHHVLSQLIPSRTPEFQSFWSRGITPQTLLPPNIDNKERKKLGLEQMQLAKRLCLVSRRLRNAFIPIIWSRFECGTATGLRNLRNACAGRGELGGYIQHLALQLRFKDSPMPVDSLSDQLEAIWPRLTSLQSLTLVLTSGYSCPAWLASQLQSVSTLQTLRLCIFGNSLGPHLRSLPQLQNLFLEVHPPDLDGRISNLPSRSELAEVPREVYHDWTDLFNDVLELIEANSTGRHPMRMTWFIFWTMVHSFYRHMKQHTPALPKIRHINLSSLENLSRLSLTLESQMGTRPFLDAVAGLPLTDLAFTSYGLSLLNGTAFRVFCGTFPNLRRLRIKLRMPSITVGDGTGSLAEGLVNEVLSRHLIDSPTTNDESFRSQDEFIKGITSLRHLEAYKGPVLFQRQTSVEAHHSLRVQVKASLVRLLRALRATGAVNPEALFQWHIWSDGRFGPKEYMILPDGGPEALGVDAKS